MYTVLAVETLPSYLTIAAKIPLQCLVELLISLISLIVTVRAHVDSRKSTAKKSILDIKLF